ncbi:GNAT family N-acetyltransferase [Actinomycetes bacterium KLBMP 9797]
MLRRQDVGHRVVVRRIVGIRNDRPLYSDALGELIEVSETDLTLATASGPLRVPLDQVHRAKRVPPARRPNAAHVVALELASHETWPAPVQDRLGEWLLRAAEGWSGRGNSALPIGDPDRPLEAAIDAVQRWYADRDMPALVNVPLPLAAPVNAALDARGWGARPLTLFQTAPLPAVPARVAVELATAPSDGWWDIVGARKGGIPAAARHILTAVPQVRFAHVYEDRAGELLAIGRGAVTADRRWLALSVIEVVPEARRRGLAQQVVGALANWAGELGVPRAFLQVEERNTAAVALYAKLGFTTHHSYLTRTAP